MRGMHRRVVADNENLGVLLSCTPNAMIHRQVTVHDSESNPKQGATYDGLRLLLFNTAWRVDSSLYAGNCSFPFTHPYEPIDT
jgi:hypothetical protein